MKYPVLKYPEGFDPHKPENRPKAKAMSRAFDEWLMDSGQVSPQEMQKINGGAVHELFKKGNAKIVWQPLPEDAFKDTFEDE